MDLKDFYYLTVSISSIVIIVFLLIASFMTLTLGFRLKKILIKVDLMISRGIKVGLDAGYFIRGLIEKIKNIIRF